MEMVDLSKLKGQYDSVFNSGAIREYIDKYYYDSLHDEYVFKRGMGLIECHQEIYYEIVKRIMSFPQKSDEELSQLAHPTQVEAQTRVESAIYAFYAAVELQIRRAKRELFERMQLLFENEQEFVTGSSEEVKVYLKSLF